MYKTVKFGILVLGAIVALAACDPNKKNKNKSNSVVIPPACTNGNCPVIPPGGGTSASYTRMPYGWSGPFTIVDPVKYAQLLQSVSPYEFCEEDSSFLGEPECGELTSAAQQSYVAGQMINDGLLYIGLSALTGNPSAEVGFSLVKSLGKRYWVAFGRTDYTNGGGSSGRIDYFNNWGTDVYLGQFGLQNNNAEWFMTTSGVNPYHQGRTYDIRITTVDLSQPTIQVEIWVQGVKTALATLTRTFNYSNSLYYYRY